MDHLNATIREYEDGFWNSEGPSEDLNNFLGDKVETKVINEIKTKVVESETSVKKMTELTDSLKTIKTQILDVEQKVTYEIEVKDKTRESDQIFRLKEKYQVKKDEEVKKPAKTIIPSTPRVARV